MGKYVAVMKYRDGRYFVSNQRTSVWDWVRERSGQRRFSMDDLKFMMEMPNGRWNQLIAEGRLDNTYPSVVMLVYYFFHLDGDGNGKHIREYVRAIASKEMKEPEAAKTHLLRGRSYEEVEQDIKDKFSSEGIRVEIYYKS